VAQRRGRLGWIDVLPQAPRLVAASRILMLQHMIQPPPCAWCWATAAHLSAPVTPSPRLTPQVAHRATLIYFLIAEFSVVNCMYQTSLAQVGDATVFIALLVGVGFLPPFTFGRSAPPTLHARTWACVVDPPRPPPLAPPPQFNELYEKAIDGSERASLPSKRISNIIEHMTYEIYL
jgi:dynein heavy chain